MDGYLIIENIKYFWNLMIFKIIVICLKNLVVLLVYLNYDFKLAMKCVTNIIARRTYGKKLGIEPKDMDAIVFTWSQNMQGRKSLCQ